jgi:hypothetical protein
MTQRYQIGGTLGPHDTGQLGNSQSITFPEYSVPDQSQGLRLHDHSATSNSESVRFRFVANVHHAGLAAVIQMG